MDKYEIVTHNGINYNRYYINENNEIRNITDSYSGNWFLIGFIKKNKTMLKEEDIVSINDFISLSYEDKFYKNGKCKYIVVDNDYGTIRSWVHGNEIVRVR